MVKVEFKSIEFVRLEIAKSGQSLRDFSKSIGISQSYLSQLLNGKYNPSPQIAFKIASGLGDTFDKFFLVKTIDKTINNVKKGN